MKGMCLVFSLVTTAGLFTFWFIGQSAFDDRGRHHRRVSLTRTSNASGILRTPVRGEDNVFFIESSCAISGPEKSTVTMKPRQACAVESAASLNPKKSVYYIDTCLDVGEFGAAAFSEEVVRQVFHYANVFVFPVSMSSYLRRTPLEGWLELGELNGSVYPVAHASDVLRLVTLWKYGGLYLDIDMVLVRPLDDLGWNFAVAESSTLVGNSVLSFSARGIGHEFAEMCLKELAETYDGKVKLMHEETCSGFSVKRTETFFPFPYQLWQLLFSEELEDFVMRLVAREETHAVHAWNKMSRDRDVRVGSRQPYAQLVARYCRRVCFSAGAVL
ncbi:lactosylceramide 4-alpha-galactosyltransferase-like isoform X2 [Bacillus rossius redtenbacheri]|uniref:lactosylceramide 4-alpha-galactosyltransferase-like isoform X2 n=1 Tax=Bacillus rossius redtenbacheri TaxID=93214 RepID=UPI002FDD4D0D